MVKKIDLGGGGDNEQLLHADMDRGLVVIAERMFEFMENEFRARNPDKPEEWRLMCGGCMITILRNLLREVIRHSEATRLQREVFLEEVVNLRGDAITALLAQVLSGRGNAHLDLARLFEQGR